MYDAVRQDYQTYQAHQEALRRLYPEERRNNRKFFIVVIGSGVAISALIAAATLVANIYAASVVGGDRADPEFVGAVIWYSMLKLALRTAGFCLIPLFLYIVLPARDLLCMPLHTGMRWVADRFPAPPEPDTAVILAVLPKQSLAILLVIALALGGWYFPESFAWPLAGLELGLSATVALELYLVTLLACLIIWRAWRRAMAGLTDEQSRRVLAAWLSSAQGARDFLELPVTLATCLLLYAYVFLPAMNWTLQAAQQGVRDFLQQDISYQGRLERVSRPGLAAALVEHNLGDLTEFLLPTEPELSQSLSFQAGKARFRHIRDQTMAHLIPLLMLMTAFLLFIRRDLGRRALRPAGP